MSKPETRRSWAPVWRIACFASLAWPSAMVASPQASPSQHAVGGWLEQEAGLVRSAECEFDLVQTPTRPEMIPAIRSLWASRKSNRPYTAFVYTADIASRHSMKIHWWRSSVKEREETRAIETPESSRADVTAFDGQEVRSLAERENRLRGSVRSVDDAHWDTTNRVQPFSFLYEFQNVPYSDLVERGRDFHSSLLDSNGAVSITFSHPDIASIKFVLTFDSSHRLLTRDFYSQTASDPAQRIYERHEFLDYTSVPDDSGETIWFPNRAIYHYFLGTDPHGNLVEYSTQEITIRSIKFNLPIPDSLFRLEFPADADLSGDILPSWWTKPRPAIPHTGRARKLWLVLGSAALIATVLGLSWIVQRAWRRAQ